MYKIIGADGKEYGPIAAEQLRQWIAEGRVNPQTQILAEGATQWRPLSDFPEFAAAAPGALPTMTAPAFSPQSVDQVAGPAIGLMVTAGLGCLLQIAGVIMRAVVPMRQMPGYPARLNLLTSGLGVVGSVVAILMGGVIFFGAIKMKKLENYNLAMAASIIAMVPCISPCCLIGLPIGIWALVILLKPEVKTSFH
jgi:hypothetical protein